MHLRRPIVLIDTFSQIDAATGIKTYIDELCASAEAYGKFDYIFFPKLSKVQKVSFFKRKRNKFKGLLYHSIYLLWKQIILPLALIYYQADVLIAPDYVAPLWRMNALKLFVVHSPFFWQSPDHYSPVWRKYYIKMIKWSFRGKGIAIATSNYTLNSLRKYLGQVPIQVVYQSPKQLERHSKKQISTIVGSDDKYLLHVGYFGRRKNLRTLVKAFSIFTRTYSESELKLVLVGSRATSRFDDDYDDVQNLIDELGLRSRVLTPGYVDDSELMVLYEHAVCYVFPSSNEGFGIPILEAMQVGLPVITSDSGSLKEIGDQAVLSFKTFDPSDLAKKIAYVVTDEIARSKLIEMGNSRLAYFSRKRFIESFENIIIDWKGVK